jgi:hypothetical protein
MPAEGIVENCTKDAALTMDALEQVQLRTQLRILETEHRDLDAAILALESAVNVDQLQLRRLKKKKLALKDQMIQIENKLIPDIIA